MNWAGSLQRQRRIKPLDPCQQGSLAAGDGDHEPALTAHNQVGKAINEAQRTLCMSYGALHATIASGRVRLATDGGAKIPR